MSRVLTHVACGVATLVGVALGMGCCGDCFCGSSSIPSADLSVSATDHPDLLDGTVRITQRSVSIRYRKSDGTSWVVSYAARGSHALDSGAADTGDSAAR